MTTISGRCPIPPLYETQMMEDKVINNGLNSLFWGEKSGRTLSGAKVSTATKRRILNYLVLTILMAQYNITTDMVPATGISFPVYYQPLYVSFSGMFLKLYFAFYLNKVFHLGKRLRIRSLPGQCFYDKDGVLYTLPAVLLGLAIFLKPVPEHVVINMGFLAVSLTFVRTLVDKTLQHFVRKRTTHLEAIIQQRTEAFLVVTHELKTPLMLSQNYISGYEKKYGKNRDLETIKSSINKIARDIVNFCDLEKVSNGMALYNNEAVTNFSETLREAVRLFSALAACKDITMTSDIESGLLVTGDPGAIDRIINNIIQNAIAYTERHKSIFIKLAADGPELVFTVCDEGIGIPDGQQKVIFDFYRRLPARKPGTDGLGLGLPIVKQVVNSLNGKIRVNSIAGKGTTFTIILPRHCGSGKETVSLPVISNFNGMEMAAGIPDDIVINREVPSILIVEDNLPLLTLLRDQLSRYYNVYVAVSGENALQKLGQGIHVNLIVSDITMNKMDGFDLCKHLAVRKKHAHLPCIFLTAGSGTSARLQGLRNGAVDYIEKPFRIEILKEKIDAILHLLERQRTALVNQAYLDLAGRETLLATPDCFDANCTRFGFTSREKEISQLLKQGVSYPDIGEALFIATNTVKKHVSHIFEKAGVNNKLQLIRTLEARGDSYS